MTHSAPRSRSTPIGPIAIRKPSISATLATMILGGFALLALPSSLQANQVYKACGKKWLAKVRKLGPEQLAWLKEGRTGELTADLDGDGRPDLLKMSNHPNFRKCDIRNLWDQKETSLRIEYATGKTKIFHWFGSALVDRLRIYPAAGRILVEGVDARGNQDNRWLQYREAPRPPIETAVARAGAESDEGSFKIASLSPDAASGE